MSGRRFDFDLFVIGVGSGGVRAARMAAMSGARVASAEDRYMGGTCVNVGCVPKKLFVHAAHFAEEFDHGRGFGWRQADREFDWPTLRDNKDREISRLNGVYRGLLDNAGVEHFDGRGFIVDPHTVRVGEKVVTAEKILVATGGWPWLPDVPGIEHALTSNEVFHLERFPARAMVGGGGYIAVEFAGIFAGLGAETELVYRGPLFLRGFDDDVRGFVADELRKKGIALRFDSMFRRIDKQADGSLAVTLTDGSVVEPDLLLCAMGRRPNTAGLGLENTGVELDGRGAIVVDEHFRTGEPSIFALGDVIDRVQLTPVAIREAMAFVETWFLGRPAAMDYEAIPTAVFCQPNIGTAGLTEAAARAAGHEVDVYRSEFGALKHALSGSDERTLMKLVVDRASDRVLGVHMVGADAGEIIQGMGVALKAGATKAVFDATVAIHPTVAEEFVTMRTPVAG